MLLIINHVIQVLYVLSGRGRQQEENSSSQLFSKSVQQSVAKTATGFHPTAKDLVDTGAHEEELMSIAVSAMEGANNCNMT